MGKLEKKEKSEAIDEEESNSQPDLMRSEEEKEENEDAEANEDLSLKIVEKAMLRVCSNVTDEEESDILTNSKKKKDKNIVTKEDPVSSGIDKGFKSFCSDMFPYKVKEEQNADTTIAMNIDDSAAEKTPVEVPDNAVLRRLLRGPRYFDAPDKSWGTCYNCGEEGHAAVNCTSARRKKPCFVCGSFEHNAKHCTKVSGENCLLFYLNM
uniref:Uncharacterized protein isoform X2 n=1 Tax=Nicotiana tabacum TaxID=4097 RepID=A0A1S4A3I7_TOBAC|nr:PREDICTED: uncharacterized protein LOC107793402 isoform X2 [Nicotiana tabacum]